MGSPLEVIDAELPVGVAACFTTRSGGRSEPPWDALNLAGHVGDEPSRVATNRALLAQHLGTSEVSFPEQVHGAQVQIVDAARTVDLTGADALVTAEPGIAVGVLVADCMPVLLADPGHRVVGAVHAGRRGLAAGVLQATLDAMTGLGADRASTYAVIGPAICGRCYEVPADMRAAVSVAVPGTASETRSGTPALDLPSGAVGVLEAAGLARVISCGLCTAEDGRLYSYRRDGVTGRFAGVVMLDPDD